MWPPSGRLCDPAPKAGIERTVAAVKASLMLADYAEAVGNKLYICGGGWSVAGPGPVRCAIALDLKVPWDQREDTHTLRFDLLDSDGQPVLMPTPAGPEPLWIESQLQLEENLDPTLKPGMSLDAAFAIVIGPMPIPPGGRYVWQLTINGDMQQDWRVAFSTRPALEEAA
jgi:hypothetical protein